jgi:hypothetical protein
MPDSRWLGPGQGQSADAFIPCSPLLTAFFRGVNHFYTPVHYTPSSFVLQLLGSQSNDIDIAVKDMMGLAFAERLVAFARARGIEATDPAVIKSNPDQSKHLETAVVRVCDVELDVVNLRSEEYAAHSRIPTEVVSVPPALAMRYFLTATGTEIRHPLGRRAAAGFDDQCAILQRTHPFC